MRLPHSTRSEFFALVSTTVLLAALAAPVHAAPDPDVVDIALAYGQLSVFVLDVAAGNS